MDNFTIQETLPKSVAAGGSGVNTLANLDDILKSANECIRKNAAESKDSEHLGPSTLDESELASTAVSKESETLTPDDAELASTVDKVDPPDEESLMLKKINPIVNFDDDLTLTSDVETQAVLVNYSLGHDTTRYDTKDFSLGRKRERVRSKLTSYYESCSIDSAPQSDKPKCITNGSDSSSVDNNVTSSVTETGDRSNQYHKSENSNSNRKDNLSVQNSQSIPENLERRFVLIGPTVKVEGKLRKQLLSQIKPRLSPHSSPGKFSPGKGSPSRRKSIMHPLICSPSSSDHAERKYVDFSPSSPCSFTGEQLSKMNAQLVPLPNDLIMRVEEQLASGKRKLDSSEQLIESSLKKAKTESSNNEDKKKRTYHRRKTPHIRLKQFNSKKKKPSVSSTAEQTEVAEDEGEEYEVEYLESHKILEDNHCLFFVKWVGWDSNYNSWEPITNLLNCQEKLVDYFEKLISAGERQEMEILLYNAELSKLRQEQSQATDGELIKLLASYRSKNGLQLPRPNKDLIERMLQLVSEDRPEEEIKSLKEKLKPELMLDKLCAKRKAQLHALKEWELEINFLAQNSALITVENEVDLEGPPPNFNYINHYLPGENVTIPNDPPLGCDCPGGCSQNSPQCCGKESGFAYDNNGRIKVPRGTPIYECNNRCACSEKCKNRVIQGGQKHRLCIFKTFNGCGWGVKTLEDIKKGSFITKYVGEVVTEKEAALRSKTDSKFYLFDLDFNCDDSSSCPYTVDASVCGNISHFINHSCDPNLAIYAAWINCLDPNIPLLVLFAIKDIKKGDELCFSYSRTDTAKRGKGEVKCKCSASNCRKYVF